MNQQAKKHIEETEPIIYGVSSKAKRANKNTRNLVAAAAQTLKDRSKPNHAFLSVTRDDMYKVENKTIDLVPGPKYNPDYNKIREAHGSHAVGKQPRNTFPVTISPFKADLKHPYLN